MPKYLSFLTTLNCIVGASFPSYAHPKIDPHWLEDAKSAGLPIQGGALQESFDRMTLSSHMPSAMDDDASSHETRSAFGAVVTERVLSFREIPEVRRSFFKGKLEVTPELCSRLPGLERLYGPSFRAYDAGLYVKQWPASLGFQKDPHHLLNGLQTFLKVRALKCEINWDVEGDRAEFIDFLSRAVYQLHALAELDLSGCRLTDEEFREVMGSFEDPSLLRILNLRGNRVNTAVLAEARKHFSKLEILDSDEGGGGGAAAAAQPGGGPTTSSLARKSQATSPSTIVPPIAVEKKTPAFDAKLSPQGINDLVGWDPRRYTYYPKINSSELARLAEEGNSRAQFHLARWYALGDKGLPKDIRQASQWYLKAAEQGDDEAIDSIVHLILADKIEFSGSQVVHWLQKPAEGAHEVETRLAARRKLGAIYAKGYKEIKQSSQEAISWYRRAADEEDDIAQYELGVMYEGGICGLPQDPRQALYWYKKANRYVSNASRRRDSKIRDQAKIAIERLDKCCIS